MKNKDGIIFALFFISMTLFGLYMSARHDASEANKSAQRMFRMLPEHKQKRLIDDHETSMELLDAGAHRNQWDR